MSPAATSTKIHYEVLQWATGSFWKVFRLVEHLRRAHRAALLGPGIANGDGWIDWCFAFYGGRRCACKRRANALEMAAST
jgi:hypothetical protein